MSKRFPNISVEKFAAYLDNNLPEDEMTQIDMAIDANEDLHDLVRMNDAIDNGLLGNDFELPLEILNDSMVISDVTASINDDLCVVFEEFNGILQGTNDRFFGNNILYGKDGIDADGLLTENTEQLESLQEMESSYRTIGESGENIYDPLFIKQPNGHSCGLKSQQIILRDFGVDIPFDDLEQIATESGVYFDYGTKTEDLGKVLEMANIGTHKLSGANMYDLTNELAQGHRVLVNVDSQELWYNDSLRGKMKNWLNDAIGKQGGNHALIVAGVEVNPSHPDDVKVVLTDSGSGHLRIEYPLDQFMDAWKDSNFYMVATNEAAPFQYDVNTGKEVPSGFDSKYRYNHFVIDNGYQLSSDGLLLSPDYHPTFSGHLNRVGNLSYEDFCAQHLSMDGLSMDFLGEDSESAGGIGSGMLGADSESTGSIGSGMLGEDSESAGGIGSIMLGADSESTGSIGSGMLGEDSESAGGIGSIMLGADSESTGSIGSGILGEDSESTGGIGSGNDDFLADDDFDMFPLG